MNPYMRTRPPTKHAHTQLGIHKPTPSTHKAPSSVYMSTTSVRRQATAAQDKQSLPHYQHLRPRTPPSLSCSSRPIITTFIFPIGHPYAISPTPSPSVPAPSQSSILPPPRPSPTPVPLLSSIRPPPPLYTYPSRVFHPPPYPPPLFLPILSDKKFRTITVIVCVILAKNCSCCFVTIVSFGLFISCKKQQGCTNA